MEVLAGRQRLFYTPKMAKDAGKGYLPRGQKSSPSLPGGFANSRDS